jgi:hypothetical protein
MHTSEAFPTWILSSFWLYAHRQNENLLETHYLFYHTEYDKSSILWKSVGNRIETARLFQAEKAPLDSIPIAQSAAKVAEDQSKKGVLLGTGQSVAPDKVGNKEVNRGNQIAQPRTTGAGNVCCG